jgi:hypothetical protein
MRIKIKMRTIVLICLVLLIGSGMGLAAQDDYQEYAYRTGKLRLGADITVPTSFISLELTEFLGGPTIHYGLTDRIELKATVAPLVRISSLLSEILEEETDGAVSLFAIGLVEAGLRYYLSPYKDSWFIDGELVAGFVASDYNFIEDNDSFMFKTAGSAFGVSLGYDWGGGLSVEAGAYLINPTLDLGDFSLTAIEFLIPIPKISVSYML